MDYQVEISNRKQGLAGINCQRFTTVYHGCGLRRIFTRSYGPPDGSSQVQVKDLEETLPAKEQLLLQWVHQVSRNHIYPDSHDSWRSNQAISQ